MGRAWREKFWERCLMMSRSTDHSVIAPDQTAGEVPDDVSLATVAVLPCIPMFLACLLILCYCAYMRPTFLVLVLTVP